MPDMSLRCNKCGSHGHEDDECFMSHDFTDRLGPFIPNTDYAMGEKLAAAMNATATRPSRTMQRQDLRNVAGYMIERKFGIGLEIAQQAIRNDPIACRIYECAVQAIVDLLEQGYGR